MPRSRLGGIRDRPGAPASTARGAFGCAQRRGVVALAMFEYAENPTPLYARTR